MSKIGIALDLGTSGFRAQAIELASGRVVATAMTMRHPLPGGNVIDHLHFALGFGVPAAQALMVKAINQVMSCLGVATSAVTRLAVCGNPIQLSLFEGIEIRDLAYAGKSVLVELGVTPPDRGAKVKGAADIPGLKLPAGAEVIIPPGVQHEVGADALAMILKSGMLEEDRVCLVTDYGTNAEMALKVGGNIITGSAACGPAMEGQAVRSGMLAAPGAVCDAEWEGDDLRYFVLDEEMQVRKGDLVDVHTGAVRAKGELRAKGITGTGTVAILCEAMKRDLVKLPDLATADGKLHLNGKIALDEKDLSAVGRAFGAIRAGHIALAAEAGIAYDDIEVAFMAGALGTYVDPLKARHIGLVPAAAKIVCQIGNTSLEMAKDLVRDPSRLESLERVAKEVRAAHCMFATSATFKNAYALELGYWNEGMPLDLYRRLAVRQKLLRSIDYPHTPELARRMSDISDIGEKGIQIASEIGTVLRKEFEGCNGCRVCLRECPEDALRVIKQGDKANRTFTIDIQSALCEGMACRRCELSCPLKVLRYTELAMTEEVSLITDPAGVISLRAALPTDRTT